jgi:hypothetical protein
VLLRLQKLAATVEGGNGDAEGNYYRDQTSSGSTHFYNFCSPLGLF